MAESERDSFPMSLVIEGGAARVRITEPNSPVYSSREQSHYPRHRMTLRSHARTSSSLSDQSSGDLPRPQPSSVNRGEAMENWSEATTEIQSVHENPYSFSEASRSTSPEDTERPFLSVQSSPIRNELRIWESNAPTDSNFTIWEDPPNIETPARLSPAEWVDLEDDKENNYATVSDYDSEEEELQEPRIDWVTVTPGPRDAFGLPIETPTRPPVHGLAGGGHLVTPVVVPPMPADTEMNFRIARRVIPQDEQDIEEEWDDSLSSNQIRELQELNDIYTRHVEHRRLHGRQFPMRDSNGQGQANVFLEARRITEFQRHESRRRSNGDLDED